MVLGSPAVWRWAPLSGNSVLWDRVARGHGSTRCQCHRHSIAQAQRAPRADSDQGAEAQPVPTAQQPRTDIAALARAHVPGCPPQPPPVPVPCLPGTVIVQLLRGGGWSPGDVCVSKGLCGKITRAGGGRGGGGRREPTAVFLRGPTATPELGEQRLCLPSMGYPRGPMSCLRGHGVGQRSGIG